MKKRIYTEYLNYNTASNILHAFDFSKFIGKPLNVLITINFYNDENAYIKFQKIRELYSGWIRAKRKKSGKTSYLNPWIYVFENPHSNIHVHWALNIEDDFILDFYEKLEKWIPKYVGSIRYRQIDVRPINIYNDKVLANYLAKGVNPPASFRLNLQKYRKYQGFVRGPRAGVARCLGKAARKKAGFLPRRDRYKWATMHPELMIGHIRPADWDLRVAKAQSQRNKQKSAGKTKNTSFLGRRNRSSKTGGAPVLYGSVGRQRSNLIQSR